MIVAGQPWPVRQEIEVAVLGAGNVLLPIWMFAESVIGSAQTLHENANIGSFAIRPLPEDVKGWPLVGDKSYQASIAQTQSPPDDAGQTE